MEKDASLESPVPSAPDFSPYVNVEKTPHTLYRHADPQSGGYVPRFFLPRDPALLGYPNPMGALYTDTCFGRMPPAFLIGLGGGAAFAFVMETFSNNGVANYTLGAPIPPSKPLKEEFGVMLRSYGKATVRMSKSFAPHVVGTVAFDYSM